MKKLVSLLLALALLTVCAGCGRTTTVGDVIDAIHAMIDPDYDPNGAYIAAYVKNTEDFEEVVLADNDQFTVTVVDCDMEGYWGQSVTLLLQNKTSRELMFDLDDISVNGVMCDPWWAESVSAGKAAYSEVSWYYSDLKDCGVNYLETIEGVLSIYDYDSWDELLNESFTLTLESEDSSGPATRTVSSSSGFEALTLVDNDDITVTVVDYDPEDSWGPAFTLYLENRTDKTLTFFVDDVSVNGIMCDPYWSANVTPGKVAYSQMDWYSFDLEYRSIDAIEEVELTLTVQERDVWYADDVYEGIHVITVE